LKEAFITFLYIGYIKPAPGTWGSASAILLAYPLHIYGGPFLLFFIIVLLTFLGTIAIARSAEGSKKLDRDEIVLDEVVGQLIALLPISMLAHFYQLTAINLGLMVFISFLSFRFFDIVKIGLIKQADQRKDAFGVMLDDIYAGLTAAMLIILIMVIVYAF
tara:strand:- start:106 stop:588 length:483 start_codon:yes stop_codon:yes gene_type:complete